MKFVDYLYTPEYACKPINHCDLILTVHKFRDMTDKYNVAVAPLPKSSIPKSSIDAWNEHNKYMEQVIKEIVEAQPKPPVPEPDSMKRLLRDVECRVRERKDVVSCLKKLGYFRLSQLIERGDHEGAGNDWWKTDQPVENQHQADLKQIKNVVGSIMEVLMDLDDCPSPSTWSGKECDLMAEAQEKNSRFVDYDP